jgi:ketosteroid isomerase-like protein
MRLALTIGLVLMIAAALAASASSTSNKPKLADALSQRIDSYGRRGTSSMGTEIERVVLPEDNGSALIQMEQQWNEALKAHNLAWFEKSLADDFTDISSGNGTLSTKEEDIANLKVDKTVYESLELSNLRARVEGNAGVVTGVNHIKGHDEQGKTFDVRLSFTDTYIRRHGRWQAWASQHTRVRP